MRVILIGVAALALFVRESRAQAPRPARAFEPSVTTSFGVRTFGTRARTNEGAARYSGSMEIGFRGDLPLTRRTAFMADLSLAPFARQESASRTSTTIRGNALAATITGAIAARFKPRAPVFFYGGLAAIFASKRVVPVSGSSVEPALAFGAGYDALQNGPWNLRAVYSGYLLKPRSLGSAITVESTAYDWSFHLGAHYTPSRRDARGATR